MDKLDYIFKTIYRGMVKQAQLSAEEEAKAAKEAELTREPWNSFYLGYHAGTVGVPPTQNILPQGFNKEAYKRGIAAARTDTLDYIESYKSWKALTKNINQADTEDPTSATMVQWLDKPAVKPKPATVEEAPKPAPLFAQPSEQKGGTNAMTLTVELKTGLQNYFTQLYRRLFPYSQRKELISLFQTNPKTSQEEVAMRQSVANTLNTIQKIIGQIDSGKLPVEYTKDPTKYLDVFIKYPNADITILSMDQWSALKNKIDGKI
jgi:hypothetical protein